MERVKLRTIREFRAGNKDAFDDIFYAYRDILYYMSYYYVRDYDDANDCVQEVFIRLVNKIHLFDERKASFNSWFFLLARHSVLNTARIQIRRRMEYLLDEEAVYNTPSQENRELKLYLQELEEILGKTKYIIYVFRTAYKLTFENIAIMLDLNREKTRRLYCEALKRVVKYMEEDN